MSHNWARMHTVLRDTRTVLERSLPKNRARRFQVLSAAMRISQLRKEIQELEKKMEQIAFDIQPPRPRDEPEEGDIYFTGV